MIPPDEALSESVQLTGAFPGGNPRSPEGVVQDAPGRFRVYPECESGETPAYKFRCDLQAINRSPEARRVELRIHWRETNFAALRDHLYLRVPPDDGWTAFSAKDIDQRGAVTFELDLPPGHVDISQQPRFGQRRLWELPRGIETQPFITINTWPNQQPRAPIHWIRVSGGGAEKPAILAAGGVHPYETAGMYCVEGMLRRLASDREFRAEVTRRHDILLIPMIAPEGVNRGYCRMNGNGDPGIDLSRGWDDSDPACRLLLRLTGQYRIAGYMEIHNWMFPDIDGVLNMNRLRTLRFRNILGKKPGPAKPWKEEYRYGFVPRNPRGVMKWMKEKTGCACLTLEYPWRGRSVEDMSDLGAETLKAFCAIL